MNRLSDDFFKKVEKKTKVKKETILNIASKIQQKDLKDESTIRDLITELSAITNQPVSKEKQDKIVNAVINNKVPNNINKMF